MFKRPVAAARPAAPILASADQVRSPIAPSAYSGNIICLGASTGGTEAIKVFLEGIPARCPPILIVQHMPETFTGSFARRLDSLSSPRVVEAMQGDAVCPGIVYVAPGHSHMLIRRANPGYAIELVKSPPVNRHRPSVDVLFHSAATLLGKSALGVLLTGMGKDGAEGLLAMRQAGARTFAQDEKSCVVFGMPREAILRGGADEILPLDQMAARVLAAP